MSRSYTSFPQVQRSPTVCLMYVITENPKGALCSKLETKGKMNKLMIPPFTQAPPWHVVGLIYLLPHYTSRKIVNDM
jgi:hypothetical protein